MRFQNASDFKSLKYIPVCRWAELRAAINPEICIRFLEFLRFLVLPQRQYRRWEMALSHRDEIIVEVQLDQSQFPNTNTEGRG